MDEKSREWQEDENVAKDMNAKDLIWSTLKQIFHWMELHDISSETLAKKLEMDHDHLMKLFNCHIEMDLQTLADICHALGIKKPQFVEVPGLVDNMIAGSIRTLTHVPRYATHPMQRTQNVAEHSFYVAYYCMCIWNVFHKRGLDLDAMGAGIADLLTQALSHDVEERVSGDIVHNFKNTNPELHEKIDSVARHMSRQLFLYELYPEMNVYSSDFANRGPSNYGEGILAEILRLADIMDVAAKLLEEAEMGNQFAASLLIKQFIPGIAKLAELKFRVEEVTPAERMKAEVEGKPVRELTEKEQVNSVFYWFYTDMVKTVEHRVHRGPADKDMFIGMWDQEYQSGEKS
jgi:5'-deoxynucleotidase YfbR-like HD superfamily hydrolase